MRFVKYGSSIALTVCLPAIICVAWSGAAWAETISSNVALFQTVTVESGTIDDDGNGTTTGYGPASNMTNDLNDGTYRQVWFTTNGVLSIDLGNTYNLDSLYLGFKDVTYAKGAKLRAYAADGTTVIGATYTVPSTSGSTTYTPDVSSDWDNVRYIKIVDDGTTPATMRLRELRAFAPVEAYPNLITGVTATATSDYSGADQNVSYLCNNAGMSDQRTLVGDPAALSLVSGPFWQPASGVFSGTVTFDLGQVRSDLDRMLVWNLNQTGQDDRCMKDALIEYSVDNDTWVTTSLPNDGNVVLSQVTLNTPSGHNLAVDLKAIEARYVRITGLTGYGNGTENVGLSEVRFYAVPEPSLVVMLLAGLGLVGVIRRR